MPFIPMYQAKEKGLKCSVTPVSDKNGGGWYCCTCDKHFGERANPPCGEIALPNEKYDRPNLPVRENVLRDIE